MRTCDKRRCYVPHTECTPSQFHSDASRSPETKKRRLPFNALRVLFGTGYATNEDEPPRKRRRLSPFTLTSTRVSSAPASSLFTGTSAMVVAASLKPTVSTAAHVRDDDAESVECLGDVGIDEHLARRQKEQGIVDLTGGFSAVD